VARNYKAMVRRFYSEVFEKGNIAYIDKVCSKSFKDHDPTNPTGDLAGVREGLSAYRRAFPDMKATVDFMMQDGNLVAARFTVKGTHKGDLLGIKATGKKVTVGGIDIVRFARGKAVEHWGEMDSVGMLVQLGVMKPPA
jgi:predicted ester cyclase